MEVKTGFIYLVQQLIFTALIIILILIDRTSDLSGVAFYTLVSDVSAYGSK